MLASKVTTDINKTNNFFKSAPSSIVVMPSIVFATTSIVLLIQNVITKEFLMYDGSSVVAHGIQTHQGQSM